MNRIAVILLLLLVFIVTTQSANGYAACGHTSTVGSSNIVSHIDKLMQFRTPEWAWQNTPEAVLALQLTNQASFFGRDKTLTAMKNEMLSEWESMNLGKLGLYVMAVKSACKDPTSFGGKNLVLELNNRLKGEFRSSVSVPISGWYQYSLAVVAQCVSGGRVKRSSITRLIRGQNEDGSFGDSVVQTSQVILALSCTLRQNPPHRSKVAQAVDNGVTFIQSSIVWERNKFWMGDKYSTPWAVLALMESGNVESASCSAVMKSLDKPYASSEPESAFNQRLPALAGRSYLALMNGWNCQPTGPVPENYQPTFDPNSPKNCNEISTKVRNFQIPVSIQIRIKVFDDVTADITSDVPTLDIIVDDVNRGNTLLDILKHAECMDLIRFITEMTSWGASIKSVEGIGAVSENREFWSLLHENGDWLSVGAGQYQPSNGETIILKLATW